MRVCTIRWFWSIIMGNTTSISNTVMALLRKNDKVHQLDTTIRRYVGETAVIAGDEYLVTRVEGERSYGVPQADVDRYEEAHGDCQAARKLAKKIGINYWPALVGSNPCEVDAVKLADRHFTERFGPWTGGDTGGFGWTDLEDPDTDDYYHLSEGMVYPWHIRETLERVGGRLTPTNKRVFLWLLDNREWSNTHDRWSSCVNNTVQGLEALKKLHDWDSQYGIDQFYWRGLDDAALRFVANLEPSHRWAAMHDVTAPLDEEECKLPITKAHLNWRALRTPERYVPEWYRDLPVWEKLTEGFPEVLRCMIRNKMIPISQLGCDPKHLVAVLIKAEGEPWDNRGPHKYTMNTVYYTNVLYRGDQETIRKVIEDMGVIGIRLEEKFWPAWREFVAN